MGCIANCWFKIKVPKKYGKERPECERMVITELEKIFKEDFGLNTLADLRPNPLLVM